MNNLMLMLAESESLAVPTTTNAPDQNIPATFLGRLPIDEMWQFVSKISWLEAVVFVAFGIIYLIYGWRVFKALVVINFAVLGMYSGIFLGAKLGSAIWGGIIGTAFLGASSLPFMKYSISVMGALAGTILCGAFWRIIGLPDALIWCGALTGLIAGGLLVFSSFKISIMLFTSLQGSMFIVIGVLALLSGYPNLSEHLTYAIYSYVFFLPTLVVVPTISGMIFQQRLLKQEADWAMPE